MNNDEQLKKMITIRFIIPIKLIIGAFIVLLVYPNNLEIHKNVGNTIFYTLFACILYLLGDYVFYLGNKIYKRIITYKDAKKLEVDTLD